MPKIALLFSALGMLLVAVPAPKAEAAAERYIVSPPPPVILAPRPYAPGCYAALTRRERDKGIRHWTGLCAGRWG